ncbi:Rid family hydrolase [Nguyenibacter vanlangensis]|uniref:Rid family hydrolase n=1 Tax=Nguyenibacter vanlangensis TaxID=1216886 RepID=A0A7Y7IY48_9PROT|nr:Rid family hydrolase [Nguyenibacter vanlangensis]NVN12297.1 hypothetical protein [Nguyenibacter vanlangensis]
MHAEDIHVRQLTGIDPTGGQAAPSLVEQCRAALEQGAQRLEQAGHTMEDVTRVVFLMRDTDGFPACFPLLREAFGAGRPATTLRLVPGFADPATLIEIELMVGPAE